MRREDEKRARIARLRQEAEERCKGHDAKLEKESDAKLKKENCQSSLSHPKKSVDWPKQKRYGMISQDGE